MVPARRRLVKLTARQEEILRIAMENGAVACPQLIQWALDQEEKGEPPPPEAGDRSDDHLPAQPEGIFDQPKIIIQPLNGRLCI